jgi:RNA polymerase sigma-70 factor (ECF subfamily)
MASSCEIQLLDRLLTGEQSAYRELIVSHQSAMRAVAYAIAGSRNADDVVQDAWLSMVRNLAGFQGRSSLKTWLLTITANSAKDSYKKSRREVWIDDLSSSHGTIDDDRFSMGYGHLVASPGARHQDTPDALLTTEELHECLENTLLSLPELQRSVLLLRDRQGLELEEIGDRLKISKSNVGVLLHRARLKVFATVEYFEETGECLSSKRSGSASLQNT